MTFRGYFALNRSEIANSSRVAAHLGHTAPQTDGEVFGTAPDCSLTESAAPLLYTLPSDPAQVTDGLYRPPNGARRFGPGLYEMGACWGPAAVCVNCRSHVGHDDSWSGLGLFLEDGEYRPELAPWYVSEVPESGEFGGVWVMDVTGLSTTPVSRSITETVGHGAVAGPHRDTARTITFDALLVACTNAGLEYGLNWLTCQLRRAAGSYGTKLRYLTAHPGQSDADPDTLLREVSDVVLTKSPEIREAISTGSSPQATMYRVTWELTALDPYAYLPMVELDVDWDQITRQPINWIHAADCRRPETCEDMPVMFSADCVPEEIPNIQTPPPVCGGCLPVGGIDKYTYRLPTMDYPFRCRETAVSMAVTNSGDSPLTFQAFWRVCSADVRCEDNQWPLQVSGLPVGATLHLDGATGRYWADYDGMLRRPVGVVGTPNGAPWRPPLIDRQTCWDFIVQTAPNSSFSVSMMLADREP